MKGIPTVRFPRPVELAAVAAAAVLTLAGCHRCPVQGASLSVDPSHNGVLEPGETVSVEPAWSYYSINSRTGCSLFNKCQLTASLSLVLSDFSGPPGGIYSVVNAAANYGDIPIGRTQSCSTTGDCYQLEVRARGGRPIGHWDASFTEARLSGASLDWLKPPSASVLEPEACLPSYQAPKTWTLHIGSSFSDVSTTSGFYPFIENLFHHGITAGCGNGGYCPDASIRRDQISVFLLKAKYGSGYVPPPCTGLFVDVSCPGPFTDWVEQIHHEGIIDSCSSGKFCPGSAVTRRDMAVWLLKAHDGDVLPPSPIGLFADVPTDDPDAAWIEELYNRHITVGCNASPLMFCPENLNTRAQAAVFADKAFGLLLY